VRVTARARARIRPLRAAWAAAVTIAATLGGALVAAHLQLNGLDAEGQASSPAAIEPAAGAFRPPRAEAAGVPRAPASAPLQASSGASRRFVWAPIVGATGYHVELFDENSLVFAADTKQPEFSIPAKWKFDRREVSEGPLAYRWFVWPIVSGKRSSKAVVQATVVVRDR
jgi:hypothetical protein